MIFRNIRPVEVNNGRLAAILNFNDLKFFKMHPLLKPYSAKYFSRIYQCYKLGQSVGSTLRSRSKNLKRHNSGP